MDHPDDPVAAIRRFWDDDAATYDRAAGHRPRDPGVLAAWTAALGRLLPPPPAAVLDCGAGTGFLSLIAARAGHQVTALDLSPAMLEQLGASARTEGLEVTLAEGRAEEAPPGPFDVVVERHLLWTLPQPEAVLGTWRSVTRRLVLIESVWGDGAPGVERRKAKLRRRLRQLRGVPPDHHADYPEDVRGSLPFGRGTPPGAVLDVVRAAGFVDAAVESLGEVEAAERRVLPLPDRLLGVAPRFAVTAAARDADELPTN
jgi:SAM-dependent methyltransferase